MIIRTVAASRKCEWWRPHNWGKWHVTGERTIVRSDKSVVGMSIIQKRECQDCGFTKVRTDKVELI